MIEGKVNKKLLLESIKERDGLVCGICKKSLAKQWRDYTGWLCGFKYLKRAECDITLDHKISRAKLRRTPGFVYEKGWQWKDLNNLQLAHLSCNIKKADG